MLHNIVNDCYFPFSVKEILKNKKRCKEIYNIFNKKEIVPKSQEKWNRSFENIELDWETTCIYNIPAKSCNDTKLHWFQNYILHRILATNRISSLK